MNYLYSDHNTSRHMPLMEKLYYYFFVFATLYIEFGYKMVTSKQFSGTERTVLLLAICVPLLFKFIKGRFRSQPLFLFIYFTIVIGISYLSDRDMKNYILLFVAIFVGFVTASTIRFKDIANIFVNVMTFLALYSLLCFALLILAPGVVNLFPVMYDPYNSLSATVHDMGFAVVLANAQNYRNFGFAWEPGAFSVLLGSALYCCVSFYKRIDFRKVIILAVALITTFSTTGYFVLIAIFIVAFKGGKRNIKTTIVFFVIAVLFLIAGVIYFDEVYELVFQKLEGIGGSNTAETTQSRLNAIKYPLQAFFSSPVFGVGYEKFAIINENLCNGVATNTVANWFAVMGLLFGAPCTYFYFSFARKSVTVFNGGTFKLLILFFAMVLMISTESLLRISFVYTIIFYGTQKIFLPESTESTMSS